MNPLEFASSHPLRRFLPILLFLFAGSGCAALIYEVIWFQLLQLVIGSSAVSLGVLLGTYMGGMCLGSLLLPRWISDQRHPLRLYAWLETGIAVCGLAIFYGLPYLDVVYASHAGSGWTGIAIRAAVAGLCLIPPTLLMGASLPAIARWLETTRAGVSWLGFFYGGNIGGAVAGCVVAGFYLLRLYDMETATYVAAAINLFVAVVSAGLAFFAPFVRPTVVSRNSRAAGTRGAWSVYVAIGISGACALAAEVIWTRLLSLMLGATVYTFSIILAVFLTGLGLGSAAGSAFARRVVRPRLALACCQFLLVPAIAWAAWALADSLPYWPVDPLLARKAIFNFQLDVVRCLWAIFPATLLWGASFPMALAAISSRGQDAGRLAGFTYAANTVGAIAGAVGASLLLIPWIGTQQSQRVLIGLSLAAALSMLWTGREAIRNRWLWGAASVAVALGLIWTVAPVPWLAIAYGRRMIHTTNTGKPLFVGEGMNSSIVVSELEDGKRYFHVSGKVEASTEPYDMRLQRMLGHIPAMVHPKPQSVLIVGFGAGVTAGSFVVHPTIQRIVICELEKLIPPTTTQYFKQENANVLYDPRTRIHYDDARHYVLTTPEKFDIITSDPIHPWVKGTSTLYSKEYFEMCKRHLNPGGVLTQWVPLYESDPATVKSELATFFAVFPNAVIWGNDVGGNGYDIVLMGRVDDAKIDVDEMQRRLDLPEYMRVKASLNEVALGSAMSIASTYAGRALNLAPWVKDAEINLDSTMRLQYLAGMGLNYNDAPGIYEAMLQQRPFPEGLFTGTPATLTRLRQILSGH